MRFGEYLKEKGIVTEKQIEEALAIQQGQKGIYFGEALVSIGVFDFPKLSSYIKEYIRDTNADASEIEKLLSQEEADKLVRELRGG